MDQMDNSEGTVPNNFPLPVIHRIPRLNTRRRNVSDLISAVTAVQSAVDRSVVIESGTGQFYEIGRKIGNAIFGYVVYAKRIEATAMTVGAEILFVRTEEDIAIKVFTKREYRRLTGRTEEDPVAEISALQFLGNENQNVIGQLECCEDDDNIYLFMRCCPGGELFGFIAECGTFDESRARGMMRQLLNAVQHLQNLGIGHRDLSLENILFDEVNERFIVIDFGMCKRCHRTAASIANPPAVIDASCYYPLAGLPACGKRNYMAPEVHMEGSINPMLCDIWALGIILFIALTGIPPVDVALASDERYRMIAQGQLREMVMQWGMEMSDEVLDLIQCILRPDPNQRLTISQILAHPWMLG
mmetsp:Transcript_11874/g.16268  ORF Transcript_11874/g.16268 Transcript_11874/m.16268 type:complete len:359 (+) Transcript_11874:53-1129(+)